MSTAAYCEVWGRTDQPCTRPDCVICVATRARRGAQKLPQQMMQPHEYAGTGSGGCWICGVGPGAYAHNTAHVAEHRASIEFAQSAPKFDPVNKPAHYNAGGVECIDALAAATINLTGLEAVCTANAIKYLWRWKMKNGVEDLNKAIWYIEKIKSSKPKSLPPLDGLNKEAAVTTPRHPQGFCPRPGTQGTCTCAVPEVQEPAQPVAIGQPASPHGVAGVWFVGNHGPSSRRFLSYKEQIRLMNQRADSDNNHPMDVYMWDDAMAEDRARAAERYYGERPPGPPNPPPKPPGNKVG